MNNERTVMVAGILVITLLVSSVALPLIATGKPANQVPVTNVPEAGDALANPTASAWDDVEITEIPLASAPSGLPNAASVATDTVSVQAARTEQSLYVRMRWVDNSKNASTDDPTTFADAAAMQVPAKTSTHPDIALGDSANPVNVWYWNAAEGTEEILAGGQGTITEMNQSTVQNSASYDDGMWTVVMQRPLDAEGENRATFDGDTDVDVAFAVWDGANAERSGHHAVSQWFTYPTGPAETGPGYQYLLWTIAGIAIAVALIVTVVAIRRTSEP